jgi:hypothetical protein
MFIHRISYFEEPEHDDGMHFGLAILPKADLPCCFVYICVS